MSIWNNENLRNKYNFKSLDNDIYTDVCIIGGGITGVSTGYYLNKNSVNFCIIEKDTLFSKTSGSSTAKITFMHDVI